MPGPAAPELVSLGSAAKDDPKFALALNLTGSGAGVDSVLLNQFMRTVKGNQPYELEEPYPDYAQLSRPLVTRSVSIDGQTIDLADSHWKLESSSPTSATYAIDIVAGKSPVRLRKTFTISPKDNEQKGYEVSLVQSIENLSPLPVKVATSLTGVVPPPQENEGVDDRQILAAYGKPKETAVTTVTPAAISEFTKDAPSKDLVKKDDLEIKWVGASSIYFAAIAQPVATKGEMIYVGDVKAEALDPQSTDPLLRNVITTIDSAPLTLSPGHKGSMELKLFFGPKRRDILNSPYYAAADTHYDLTLTTNLGMCGNYCAWQPVINTLVWILRAFHFVTHDWGLAIIGLVILVRLALHPVTKRSTISMQKMGKMGPEVERLKKKFGDNKDELNKAMMQMYKEQGFTPVLGCLPMFLQMPIWIALYNSLQNTFELRQAPFLWGWTWIHDLAKPDALIQFAQPIVIPLVGWHIYSLNILPVFMAVVFFLQQKYQPKPPATTPEQAQQQKMMQWMSLLFPLIMYRMPSGLNLYILTSTTIGIIESKRIRDHIKQREEAEKAGRVFVEPTKKMRRKGGGDNDGDGAGGGSIGGPAGPKGGLGGWMQRLQAKAEELQRDSAKKQKRGR